ncbi:Flap-structured DNA-binding and RNA-binding protein [Naganishia albida]|nr:Flap-structured DNA-binding and RNA-binding protein [Naganishia albida]
MSAPVRQPRTPSPAPAPHGDVPSSAGFTKPPHLGRQSLGPPPPHRSHSGPLSPGAGLVSHANSHLHHQRASLAASATPGDKLAEARTASPRVVSSSAYLGAASGGGGGPSVGAGGLRNVSVGSNLSSGFGNGGLRPQSEYIGGLASGVFGKEHQMAEDALDSWFHDLQQYESTLDALATASLDQAFTDELNAIEQWFRVLSENERTAALYSLLQHATTSQIRFFQKVLSQMSQSDPMTALLSPAVGSSMQREMEARLANANASMSASNSASASLAAVTGMKSSPIAPAYATGSGFGNTPTFPSSPGFLGPDNPAAADGSSGFGSPSAQLAAQRNRNRAQNRISAPGNLHHLSSEGHDARGGNTTGSGYLRSGHLGDLIERGHSPGAESNASGASRSPNLGAIGSDARPKSADFATLAASAAAAAAAAASGAQEPGKSPFARSSPRLGSSALGGTSAHSTPETAAIQAQAQQAMVGLGLPAATTQALNQHLTVASSPSFADQFSPLLHTNWASIGNTPMLASFNPNEFAGGNMSTSDPMQLAAQLAALSASSPAMHGSPGGRIVLDDATKFRRTPSGGRPAGAQPSPRLGTEPAYASHNWRSPIPGAGQEYTQQQQQQQQHALNGLGIGMGMGLGMGQYDSGLTGLGVGMPSGTGTTTGRGGPRQSSRTNNNARKSPMIGGFANQQPPPMASTAVAGSNGGAGSGAGVGGADDVDERILKDTANWLRVLRLHKYTPNFADDKWRDMVMMDSETLESRGVAALGARRKLLRAFANVREHYHIPHPDWYVPEAVATTGPTNAAKDGGD